MRFEIAINGGLRLIAETNDEVARLAAWERRLGLMFEAVGGWDCCDEAVVAAEIGWDLMIDYDGASCRRSVNNESERNRENGTGTRKAMSGVPALSGM